MMAVLDVAVPDRSLQQRMDALQHANDLRVKRAQLKRDVKAGRQDVLRVIAMPPAYAANMKLIELLLAVPRVGTKKAYKTMGRAVVSPGKTLGGMTVRQRSEIVRLLGPEVRS